jgi:hypothetical protein
MNKCLYCDYETIKAYNLKRHVNNKHFDKENNINNNISCIGKNVTIPEEKVTIPEEKVTNEEEDQMYKCDDCYKCFKHHKSLKNHKEVCKKILHPYKCTNCDKIYKCRQNLFVHRKKCTSKCLIVATDIPFESTSKQLVEIDINETKNIINNIDHLDNQTNIQNQQNIQNNHHENITINIFPTDLHSDYNINTDHIDMKKLKNDIKNQTIGQAVSTSLRAVLQNRDNLPVIKKNLRTNYSYVHLGNDQWEMRKDKEVYGLISFHISRCIQVYLEGKNLVKMKQYFREASEALEFVASDQKDELEREYIQKAMRIMDVIHTTAYTKSKI